MHNNESYDPVNVFPTQLCVDKFLKATLCIICFRSELPGHTKHLMFDKKAYLEIGL